MRTGPDAPRVRWADLASVHRQRHGRWRVGRMRRRNRTEGGREVEVRLGGEDDFNPEELRKAREEVLMCFSKVGLFGEISGRLMECDMQRCRHHQVG